MTDIINHIDYGSYDKKTKKHKVIPCIPVEVLVAKGKELTFNSGLVDFYFLLDALGVKYD